METAKELQLYEGAPPPLSSATVKQQINLIQEIMRDAMKENEHFGKIPGCGDKPALLKPGAEKLNLTFRMAPKYTIIGRDLGSGHREFEIVCSLYSIGSEKFLGQGVGSCSTMESKYRYRNIADFEVTGDPIPKDSRERKSEYRKQGFGMKKVDNEWAWVKYKDSSRTENLDIADTYNTVLKMAKKRALVDAVLTVTAASDIFTQDIEDLPPPESPEGFPLPITDLTGKSSPQSAQKGTGGKKNLTIEEKREAMAKWLNKYGKAVSDAQDYLKKSYEDWDETDIAVLTEWGRKGFKKTEEPEEDI